MTIATQVDTIVAQWPSPSWSEPQENQASAKWFSDIAGIVAEMSHIITPVKSDWQTGFDLYFDGKSESACQNMAQIAGWWAALDAEAACNVCDRMAANGKSGAEMDDAIDGLTYHEWRYGA